MEDNKLLRLLHKDPNAGMEQLMNQYTGLVYAVVRSKLDGSYYIVAAALWNISEYKQYVVKKYRGIMKAARLFNPILPLLGYIKLPKENVPMDFPMLSFFLSKDDCREYYEAFLNEINREIKRSCGMFVIGLPRTHHATEIFSRKRCISFNTKIYGMYFSNARACENVDGGRIFPECAML